MDFELPIPCWKAFDVVWGSIVSARIEPVLI